MNARSGSWEPWDSGVAIISSRTKNMSVEGAQFVTFLKVESQRIQGRSGFVLVCRPVSADFKSEPPILIAVAMGV